MTPEMVLDVGREALWVTALLAAPLLLSALAVGLFVGAMIWVFSLNRAYVDLDRPNKKPWTDLRFWTIVSMMPHVIVYLWF